MIARARYSLVGRRDGRRRAFASLISIRGEVRSTGKPRRLPFVEADSRRDRRSLGNENESAACSEYKYTEAQGPWLTSVCLSSVDPRLARGFHDLVSRWISLERRQKSAQARASPHEYRMLAIPRGTRRGISQRLHQARAFITKEEGGKRRPEW